MKQATDLVYLSDLSPKDKQWDKRRAEADGIKNLYTGTKYEKYTVRLANCSCTLVFAFKVSETGVCELKLESCRFCRVPFCPVCQGRRGLKWIARTFKILPQIREKYPKSRFIFLTLTVRNCDLKDLRSQLTWMHQAWRKLTKRKEWKIQGWVRTTEVTRGKDDTAHPHFHCLLMVSPSYFSTGYISQQRWIELWRDCLGVSYEPVVDVRAVKASKDLPDSLKDDPLAAAIVETIKYTVKPSDILRGNARGKSDNSSKMTDQDWLVELTTQMYKTRKIATGGILKQYLRVLEEENDSDDLIHINDDGTETQADEESPRVAFDWNGRAKRYHVKSEVS